MKKTAILVATLALIASLAAPALAGTQEMTLSDAVRSGDGLVVKALLDKKADPNTVLPDTSTVLGWAAMHQNPEIVRLLLAAGAKPDTPDMDGVTPLLVACQLSDASIVSMMMDAKANVLATRPDGISVLEVCAKSSTPANLERMIALGALVDAADANGQTPLMWAAMGGKLDNMALLLKHGANVNKATAKGFTPLFFAIKSPNPKAVEAILTAGGDIKHVAVDGTNAAQLAAYEKKFRVASMLVEKGADVNKWDQNGYQLLHNAGAANDAEFAKVLLAHGADVEARTVPPQINWQKEPNAGPGPGPKFVGMTPLFISALNGADDVMKVVVAAGAKTDIRAEDGTSLVLAAAGGGGVDALAYAIELQPDLDIVMDGGNTPMHIVLQNRRAQVRGMLSPETSAMIRLLAAKGAPLNRPNDQGRQPAKMAARVEEGDVAATYAEVSKQAEVQLSQAAVPAKK